MVHDGPLILEFNNYNGHFYSAEIGGKSVMTYNEKDNAIEKVIVDIAVITQLSHLNSMIINIVYVAHLFMRSARNTMGKRGTLE